MNKKEITCVSTVGFKDATWMSTRLLCEKAYQNTNAETYVSSDSVPCVGKMRDEPIYCNLEEQKTMVFGKQSIQGYESN